MTALLRFSAVVCLAISLAACGSAGPSGRELLSAAGQPDSSFALVDINDQSLAVVASWQRPSLSAMYGDYRGPKLQRVDVGDILQVNIWETGTGGLFSTPGTDRIVPGSRPSSLPEQPIARDGTINVPYAGRIKVAGLTPQQIEQQIVQRLQGKTSDPQAIVTLSRNISNAVTISGDVANGARIPLNPRGDRILDVIAMAGGIKAPLHEAFITVSRNGTSLSLPMQAILSNTRENIYLRPDDVLTVYRSPQSFTAAGTTGRNAVINFDAGGISLEEAIGKAGGLLDDRTDPKGVFVLRYEPVALARQYKSVPARLLDRNVIPVVYRIDMSSASSLFSARRFVMHDKDILYVSPAQITEIEKVFRVVQTLTSPAVTAASIASATK
jgi:polysaccharide biosynthesis/export protein